MLDFVGIIERYVWSLMEPDWVTETLTDWLRDVTVPRDAYASKKFNKKCKWIHYIPFIKLYLSYCICDIAYVTFYLLHWICDIAFVLWHCICDIGFVTLSLLHCICHIAFATSHFCLSHKAFVTLHLSPCIFQDFCLINPTNTDLFAGENLANSIL